jgi:predicted dehydrogenase
MKLSVIGAGYWGVNLIRVFHRMRVLGCICEFNVQRLQYLAKEYPEVPVESSYAAVLNDQSVGAIVIATRPRPMCSWRSR